jgi:hypothetical protein
MQMQPYVIPASVAGSGGFQIPGRIEPIDGRLVGSVSTAAFTANSVYLFRLRAALDMVVGHIEISVGLTSAGLVSVGIYTADAALALFTRIATSGEVAAPSVSVVTGISLITPCQINVGQDYWVALGLTDSTLTLTRIGIAGSIGGAGSKALVKGSAYSSGLPSSISSPSAHNGYPYMALTT